MREMNAVLDSTLGIADNIMDESPLSTHESNDILQQASIVAEQKVKERFPTTPISDVNEKEVAQK
jgi:division protein CdvB (Snf7/Vps24/ESCRT-III family)